MNLATHALVPSILARTERLGDIASHPCPASRAGILKMPRSLRSVAEILVDARSVDVTLRDGVLSISPARHVTCLDINVEQCSDGAILISDSLGYGGMSTMPELNGELRAIHITLGVDGDDAVSLDFRTTSPLAGNIRIFSAFGDDITATYGALVSNRSM